MEQGETDRVKVMEEEIQVLTAQVNAYSREVDKQKGLVTQSQEKHKTEVYTHTLHILPLESLILAKCNF